MMMTGGALPSQKQRTFIKTGRGGGGLYVIIPVISEDLLCGHKFVKLMNNWWSTNQAKSNESADVHVS